AKTASLLASRYTAFTFDSNQRNLPFPPCGGTPTVEAAALHHPPSRPSATRGEGAVCSISRRSRFMWDSFCAMTVQPTAELTIDLGALVANYRLLQRHAKPARAAAAVKADAYGIGAK